MHVLPFGHPRQRVKRRHGCIWGFQHVPCPRSEIIPFLIVQVADHLQEAPLPRSWFPKIQLFLYVLEQSPEYRPVSVKFFYNSLFLHNTLFIDPDDFPVPLAHHASYIRINCLLHGDGIVAREVVLVLFVGIFYQAQGDRINTDTIS